MARVPTPTWTPTTQDVAAVLAEQNPWHTLGAVPEALALTVERPLVSCLWRRMLEVQRRRYQLVLGPRRVGKTTSLYQTVRHLLKEGIEAQRIRWLRLDHPLFANAPLDLLVRGFASNIATQEAPAFLFLDELAYADRWDLWLKTFYDEQWPVRIAASSSSTAALRHRRTESGVGRWDEQFLAPYLFPEFLALIEKPVEIPVADNLAATLVASIRQGVSLVGLEPLRRRFLLTGGFPELLIRGANVPTDDTNTLLESQRTLRSDAVERAVYKDIPQAFGVDNPMLLERLLYTLGGQICGLISPNAITQHLAGLSQPTFDKYLSYLEQAFIVFTLPNYSGSESAVQRRGRKLYFVDGAVRNAALQRGLRPLDDTREMGLLLENLVASHLFALSQQSQVRLYHWRDGTSEVDIVYDHPTAPLAFEVSLSPTHVRHGLRRFVERFPRFRGNCYVVSPGTIPQLPDADPQGFGALPLDLLLLASGAQAERELEQRVSAA